MKVSSRLEKLFHHIGIKGKEETKEEILFEKIVNENVEQLKTVDKREEEILKRKWLYVLKKTYQEYGKGSIGNKVEIFNNGYDTYNDILKEIERSKRRVWFEVYIFDDSKLGEEVVRSLCDAGNRGCDVILLLDFIGSFKMKNGWIKKLKENNVHVIFFNSLLNSFFNSFPFFFRDHRKLIITDDSAYCGSMNVAENVLSNEEAELLAENRTTKVEAATEERKRLSDDNFKLKSETKTETIEKGNILAEKGYGKILREKKNGMNGYTQEGIEEKKQTCLMYYDLHIKVKGPAVKHLADVFLDSLNLAQKEITRDRIEEQKSYIEDKNSCYLQILESNVMKKKKSIQSAFEIILRNATNNIYITTSYFLPPGFLRRALLYALSKGVNISFLFSGNSDILGDVPATYYIIKKFLKKNNRSMLEYTVFFRNYMHFNLYKYFNYKKYLKKRYNATNTNNTTNTTPCTSNSTIPSDIDDITNNSNNKGWILKKKKRGFSSFYFLQNKHCHAKNIVVDNLWTSIGSFNWDRYSSRRNLEVMVSIFDKTICDQLIKEHRKKVNSDSIHITLPHILNRNIFQIVLSYCFYHLGKLSGKNIFDGLSNNSKKTVLRKALVNKYLKDNCMQNISISMMWAV